MITQLVRRASYDIIIVEADFIDTENGRVELNGERYYLETNNDKDLIGEKGEKVFSVEDFSAERVIAAANGVEICGNCHKKFQVPEGNPRLMNVCECPPVEPEPVKETPVYNITPIEHNNVIISFALCQFVGEANMHISSHSTFVEAQKALKAVKPDHQIPKWCQDSDDEDELNLEMTNPRMLPQEAFEDIGEVDDFDDVDDDFDWEDEDDLYLDNGDFDHDVESAGGAESFWRNWEDNLEPDYYPSCFYDENEEQRS